MPSMGPELRGGGRGGDAIWWAAMHQVEGIGAATMLRLARVFRSPRGALAAAQDELVARGRLSETQAAQLKRAWEHIDEVRKQAELMGRQGITLCSFGDPCYPASLLDLRSPPPLLYLRGHLEAGDQRGVAVVGTREPSQEGARLAGSLARNLAERGYTVVAGLARGIDTAAHRAALSVRDGRTIAVLGGGLLRVYPPENALLAQSIARRGCLMAEVPPDREPDRRLLLARDRLQAALSQAVIVVQAHAECGSIVTARHAVRCGRPLFGVPWTEPPFSEGWAHLQKLGAAPVTTDADLDELVQRVDAAGPATPQKPLL